MCTSIIHNGKKTIVGWNLDILDMEYKVVAENDKVYIAILDEKEGWLPLFGANNRGDFVAMPTCWPFDVRSNPKTGLESQIIMLDIDLLLKNKSFHDIRKIAELNDTCSVPGVTFQAQLTNKSGDVLEIIPGQGISYIKKPTYSVLTNFSPFKGDKEVHPWMGLDRYNIANEMLKEANDDFDVKECFKILEKTSQTVCPTVVSMVFDVTNNVVYWCENREWNNVEKKKLEDLI